MKLVVAVDGSKYGYWALGWANRIPFATPTRVAAVHVVDIAALRAPFLIQPAGLTNVRFLEKEVRALCARGAEVQREAATRLAALGVRGRAALCRGPVAASLLRYAKPRSLMIVGHRGHDAIDRFMLGSVSARIVRHAPCSVLVVKQPPRPVHRVVLAVDGSEPSRKAIRFLTDAVAPEARRHMEIVVGHVMPRLKYPEVKAVGTGLVRVVADTLVKAGYPVIEAPRLGHAAAEILKLADAHEADLVVLGALGHGAVARLLLGSVSARVLDHSHASVLIAR